MEQGRGEREGGMEQERGRGSDGAGKGEREGGGEGGKEGEENSRNFIRVCQTNSWPHKSCESKRRGEKGRGTEDWINNTAVSIRVTRLNEKGVARWYTP